MKLNRSLMMAVSIVLAAAMAIGGTLAYMTDRESAVNVFTVGNVDIELNEAFDEDNANLLPGVDINKDVTIKNLENSSNAWVWYTYSIPAALDSTQDDSDMLHVDHATATSEPQSWIVDYNPDGNGKPVGYETIDGVIYNIYAVLYKDVLEPGVETSIGMTNVYLDTHIDYNPNDGFYYWVNQGNAEKIQNADGSAFDIAGTKLYVNAYAIQEDGFETVQEAYAAYADQWGTNFNAAVNNVTASNAQSKLVAGGVVNVAEDVVLTEAATEMKNAATIKLNADLISSRNDDSSNAALSSTLTISADTTIDGEGAVENTEAYAITLRDGTLTINGGHYKAVTTAINVSKGKLVITDGTFEALPYNGDYRYLINCNDANFKNGTAVVEITGGTFKEWDPSASKSENPIANFVLAGYKVVSEVKDGATWYTVVAE